MQKMGMVVAGVALLGVAAGFLAAAPVDAQTGGGPVLIVNMKQVQAQGTAFADLNAKLKAEVERKSAEFASQNGALKMQVENEANALRPRLQGKTQQQILADPALKAAVEAQARREQAYGQKAELFSLSAQNTQARATQNLLNALSPVVDEVMNARGGSVVLEASNVLRSKPTVDVTNEIVQKFNQRQPTSPPVVWQPVQVQQQPAAAPKK
jgi:outer membrane protein